MITGRDLIYGENYYSDPYDELYEMAFSEGYENAQREFAEKKKKWDGTDTAAVVGLGMGTAGTYGYAKNLKTIIGRDIPFNKFAELPKDQQTRVMNSYLRERPKLVKKIVGNVGLATAGGLTLAGAGAAKLYKKYKNKD